jgi:hypothetical protein
MIEARQHRSTKPRSNKQSSEQSGNLRNQTTQNGKHQTHTQTGAQETAARCKKRTKKDVFGKSKRQSRRSIHKIKQYKIWLTFPRIFLPPFVPGVHDPAGLPKTSKKRKNNEISREKKDK